MSEWVCSKCSKCCLNYTLPLSQFSAEYNTLVNDIRKYCPFPLEVENIQFIASGKCRFLKENRCIIYEKRPEICRKFTCEKKEGK